MFQKRTFIHKKGEERKVMKKQKSLLLFLISLAVIVVCAVICSLSQTSGWTSKITDLRNAENTGVIERVNDLGETKRYTITGKVTSGILIVPKNATKDTPAPGIVFTHGVYNNREMQEQFGIEMARRGFVTLCIDREQSGHNDDASATSGDVLLRAAIYLHNLTDNQGNVIVDESKIAVGGHSFAGMVIGGLMKLDNPAATAGTKVTVLQPAWGPFSASMKEVTLEAGPNDIALGYGYHAGIVSAALIAGCSTARLTPGANMIAIGEIKANSDDMYDGITTKEPVYSGIAKNTMTDIIWKSGIEGKYASSTDGKIYVKNNKGFVAVTAEDKFNKNTQYYKYSTTAESNYWLHSKESVLFTLQATAATANSLEKWETVNGGYYVNGTLVAQPQNAKRFLTASTKYVQVAEKGKAYASSTEILRVAYEFRGIHQFCTFSTTTAAQSVDFFYAAYGVPQGAKFIAPSNQVWTIKEGAGGIGIIALFILLIGVLDIALSTKFFSKLNAQEGEVVTGAPVFKDPIKCVTYFLTFVATSIFGAWFYCYKLDEMWPNSLCKQLIVGTGTDANTLDSLLTSLKYTRWSEVWRFAYWGVVCALFAIALTLVIWVITRVINMFRYPDLYKEKDENPLLGLKIRSGSNVGRTLLLAALLVGAFYLVVFGLMKVFKVDFTIFTLNVRTFKINRILSFLSYAPFFIVFWVVNNALGQNYRVKDLPEWLTVTLNVIASTLVFMIIIGFTNEYYISVGVKQNDAVWKNFCYAYPLIPLNALCTIVGRSFYKRTGNAWLSGIVCGTLCAIIACANQCVGLGV